MWLVHFEVEAPLGHFRNPYTTIYKQSYPFPPKPTIIGMIGAMLGWSEKETISNIDLFKVGIPNWKNDGKLVEYIYVFAYKNRKPELRPERIEVLIRPSFEIVLASESKKIIEKIAERIRNRYFEFPIYMGKNEFLISDIKLLNKDIKEEKLVNIKTPRGIVSFSENKIPSFSIASKKKIRTPQVYLGVPLKFYSEIQQKRRILEGTYGVIVADGEIKLKRDLEGFKRPCEVTVI